MCNSRFLNSILALFLFVLLGFAPLYAQTSTATLNGAVADTNGSAIPGANVTLSNTATGFERKVITNEGGSFVIPLLPPGKYILTVGREGFAPVEIQGIVLNVADQKALRIELKVGPLDAAVEVTPEASLVSTSPGVATTVDRAFVQNLPLNGRTFQSLILLTPGVVPVTGGNGEFSINGQRNNTNYYTVDGVSVNVSATTSSSGSSAAQAGNLPATTASGMTQNLVTVDDLEEFKIQTSSYTADLGRQPGGQIQLVTRSGNNQFHGSAFDYVRNEAFEANDWFANAGGLNAAERAAGLTKKPRTPLRQQLFGGTFSGPVFLPRFGEGGPEFYNGKNKTFFFFSYEGLRLLLPKTINVLVPSLCLRGQVSACAPGETSGAVALQPLLNGFPLPTGPQEADGLARYINVTADPKTHDSTSLRIDQKIGDKMLIFGRYSQTPSESLSRGFGNFNGTTAYTRSLTLGVNTALTRSLTSETRFNYTRTRGTNTQLPDSANGAVPFTASQLITGYTGNQRVQGSFIFSLPNAGLSIGLGNAVDNFNEQFNTVENLSWVKGSHIFKFGFDHRRLLPVNGPVPYSEQVSVSSASNVRADIVNVAIIASQETHPVFDNFSAYAQDTWNVTRNLTLDLGLRWDINPPPHEKSGLKPVLITGIDNLATATLAPAGATLRKTYYKGFAPRFGAAYQLFRKPGRETVIRGGFGFYYDIGNSVDVAGFSTFPFSTVNGLANVSLPLTAAQAAPLPFSTISLPTTQSLIAINPNLVLPYTLEWNLTVERSLGRSQTLSVAYVGSAARRLLTTKSLNNPGIDPVTGRQTLPKPNPNFGTISYTYNGPTADYNSMQVQFNRRLSKEIQALASYTWAHSIDEVSSDSGSGILERGNSNMDIRHNFSAAVTWNLPKFELGSILNPITHGWSLDTIFTARTGVPMNLGSASGRQILADGTLIFTRPDYVSGQPFWIKDPTAPGGKRLNPDAFKPVPPVVVNGITTLRQGSLARNAIHTMGLNAWNMALRRKFSLTEKLSLSLTAEAFNVFNHPAFGPPGGSYSLTLPTTFTPASRAAFGKATSMYNRVFTDLTRQYQAGGPRSMQFTARLAF